MSNQSATHYIEELIRKGSIQQAFDLAIKFFKTSNQKKFKDILVLSSQFQKIQREFDLGFGKDSEAENRIVHSLINLIHNKDENKRRPNQILYRKILPYSIIFLLGLLIWFGIKHYSTQQYSNEHLAEKLQADYEPAAMILREEIRLSSKLVFMKACESYSKGRFSEATNSYKKIARNYKGKNSSYFTDALLGIAMSQLQLGNYQQSSEYFYAYLENDSHKKQNENIAEWGAIISNLGQGYIDENFYFALNEVKLNKVHPFNRKAFALERKLDSHFRLYVKN